MLDDLLPESSKNARRSLTDAEVVTLCVAQAVMGISSDREFLAVARKRLGELFPSPPDNPASTSAGVDSPRRSSGC
jgi:hypothetical protein